ncbi:phosphoadenosine phosphosulfate sulfotransferase [Paraburkholderia fungorum]|uniref:phosphoadenosine phosphosulfate sulfotransferase n=1 Tax=Paraburkholderia fungorum TaxID=134537 RepID=UPI00048637EB|nr:phosphoadenosine phosphosulfate sulfotransferase [Paraburkholderia fungorum]
MKYETIELFPVHMLQMSIENRIAQALQNIIRLFLNGQPVVVAFSGGKDSSLVLAITLHAARDYAEMLRSARAFAYRPAGNKGSRFLPALRAWRNLRKSTPLRASLKRLREPFVLVTTSNTLIENPSVIEHIKSEFSRVEKFAAAEQLRVETHMVTPPLLSTWQVSVLSGRAIPSYAGMKGDCSVSYKILPQRSFRRKLFRRLKHERMGVPVTLLGTRYSESERRSTAMRARGERADRPVRNKDGEYVLSPICSFSTDDVWEALAYYGSGVWPSYSDFEDTKRIYADAGGTSCAVVADAIYEGSSSKSGKCGARFGCHLCLQTEDRSLATMVEYDPQYAYAKGLLTLNEYLRNIRYDWSRRNWIGRTIRNGYVAVGPDTLHPKTVREISRFMLQLDHDERTRARRAKEKPKFELLPLDMLIALDAMQSLYGVARPFSLWADLRDIQFGNVRYDIPTIAPVPETPLPETRFLYVGEEWDERPDTAFTGLRDSYREAMTEMGCQPELVELSSGKTAWKVVTSQSFEVDEESAFLLMDFELERMLAIHDGYLAPGGVTYGYKWYLQYGTIQLSHSQQAEHDEVCRRSEFKDRLGLSFEYDHGALMEKTVRYRDLPAEARKAWAHKATSDGNQLEMLLAGGEDLLVTA